MFYTMFHIFPAGSHGDDDISSAILQHSVYVANLFFLTSDTLAPVILDKDITDEQAGL